MQESVGYLDDILDLIKLTKLGMLVKSLENLLIPPTLPISATTFVFHVTQRLSQLKDYCKAAKIAFKYIHENMISVVDGPKQHSNLLTLIQAPSNLSTITPPALPASSLSASYLRSSELGLDNLNGSFSTPQTKLHASHL